MVKAFPLEEGDRAIFDCSWQGEFAEEFGIELHIVEIAESMRQKIRRAQREQYR